ncbi:MAG TPA: AraC family transcriptional regulator [Lachnospiraceae bacterium]|nr:AraC family transcriptional regulator [Lachnospiraceae bacterium]
MGEKRKVEILENYDYFHEPEGNNSSVAKIELDFCGLEHCLSRHRYGPHRRQNYVIHVVIEGKGTLDYSGDCYRIGKDQMFALLPGDETTYCADKEDPWYYCWIGFHGESAERIVKSIGFSSKTPVLSVKDVPEMERIVKKMLATKEMGLDGQLKRNAGLLEMLSYMITERAESAEMSGTMSVVSYAEYAARYINNHFSEKIKIQELARRIGISRSYLVKLMKQETGMSPQEYLIETRMRRASDLLIMSRDPIRNIALDCGYEDALAFSKVFKARFGSNPSEYRKIHGSGNDSK